MKALSLSFTVTLLSVYPHIRLVKTISRDSVVTAATVLIRVSVLPYMKLAIFPLDGKNIEYLVISFGEKTFGVNF